MFILQFIICFIMIEIFKSAHYLKRLFTMALTAVLTKLILMRIFMTTRAIGILNTPELLKFLSVVHFNFMTFNTIHFFMLTGKLKFRSYYD